MRENEYDYRWLRMGWFDQERPCDVAAKFAVAAIPAETMPQRWAGKNPLLFIETYGTGPRWCQTMSYHMLIVGGTPIFRLWTNAKTTVLIELSYRLATLMREAGVVIESVPAGSQKKRGEFSKRFRLTNPAELNYLMVLIGVIYGLDHT